MKKAKINFDHTGYTSPPGEVRRAVEEFLNGSGGNPLSRHFLGDRAQKALEKARGQTASLIGASKEEIIFTSSGSESNNLAVKGAAGHKKNRGKHIIVSPLEHISVMHPVRTLEKEGFEVTRLKADSAGYVSPREVEKSIREDTVLVSVIFASPEIGTLEPVKEIGEIAGKNNVLFHTDAVAAGGQVPIDAGELNVDLMSIASNPLYGPQGAAALYVKKGVRVQPLIEGGIQEGGLRAGTHNVPGIAGMGEACALAERDLDKRSRKLQTLRDHLIDGILENIPDTFLTGDRKRRLPGQASFCVKYIEGESMGLNLNMAGITSTSGSTCSSEALKVSHVLKAIGVDPVSAQGSIVFSLGIDNTREDVEHLIEIFPPIVEKLRKMSPVYPGPDSKTSNK